MSKVRNVKQQDSKTVTRSFLPAIIVVCALIGFLSIAGCQGGQDNATEPNIAAKWAAPESAWGAESNGVSIAFEFAPKKDSYATGETIGITILAKNVTKKPVSKAKTIGPGYFGHCVITPLDPNTPRMAQVNWQQSWPGDYNEPIMPQEVIASTGAEILARRFNPDGTYPPRKAPNIVYFFPGEYDVHFWLEIDRRWPRIETGKRRLVITEAGR